MGVCGSNSLGSDLCLQCHNCRFLIALDRDRPTSITDIVKFVHNPLDHPFHWAVSINRQCPPTHVVVIPHDQYSWQAWIITLLAIRKAIFHIDRNSNLLHFICCDMGGGHSSPMHTISTPTPVLQMGDFVLIDLSSRRGIWSCSGLRLPYFFFYLRAVFLLINLSLSFILLPLHRPNTLQRHVVAHFTTSW